MTNAAMPNDQLYVRTSKPIEDFRRPEHRTVMAVIEQAMFAAGGKMTGEQLRALCKDHPLVGTERHRASYFLYRGFLRAIEDAPEPRDQESYLEGARRRRVAQHAERNPEARRAAIAHHGACCAVCGFDFGATYGELGEGFIHVHHREPIGLAKAEREVDPIRDLIPLCPNCHAMVHRVDPPMSPETLKILLDARSE